MKTYINSKSTTLLLLIFCFSCAESSPDSKLKLVNGLVIEAEEIAHAVRIRAPQSKILYGHYTNISAPTVAKWLNSLEKTGVIINRHE